MKFSALALIGSMMMAATPSFAAMEHLNCSIDQRQEDMRTYSSFRLDVNSRTAAITRARLTDQALDELQSYINDDEAALKADLSKQERKNVETHLKGTIAFKTAGSTGLSLKGANLAYIRAPKTPRRRYPLQFAARGFDGLAWIGGLAPDADRLTLFIPLDESGEPSYKEIWFEYDGGQGPYYDHFTCENARVGE
jgi:hypothetical protein